MSDLLSSWIHTFPHAQFLSYLSWENISEFSKCSSTIFNTLKHHISNAFYFKNIPIKETKLETQPLKFDSYNIKRIKISYLPPFSVLNSITHIYFTIYFNERVDNLPVSITHLHIGQKSFGEYYSPTSRANFNKPINHLPPFLTHLMIISSYFNQKLDKLPSTIKKLVILHISLTEPLINLPKSLTHLTLVGFFVFCSSNLPSGVTFLNLVPFKRTPNLCDLPKNITHLILSEDKLHQSLTPFQPDYLQSLSLKILKIAHWNIDGTSLVSLKKLKIVDCGKVDSIYYLPPNLTHLDLTIFSGNLPETFPPTLTHFRVKHRFQGSIDNLPTSIAHLQLPYDYNWPDIKLPPSLTHLHIGTKSFIQLNAFPHSLVHLTAATYTVSEEKMEKTKENLLDMFVAIRKNPNHSALNFHMSLPMIVGGLNKYYYNNHHIIAKRDAQLVMYNVLPAKGPM